MDARELRIGNIVQQGKYTPTITLISNDEIRGTIGERDYGLHIPNISGIPITPEILESCGFELDYTSNFGGYLINISEDEQIRIVKDNVIGWIFPLFGNTPIKVPHLHQLQNLYWCLTRQELTINF